MGVFMKLNLFLKKKGQISIDGVLAVMTLLLISLIFYQQVFSYTDGFKDALLADRMSSIGDNIENYALLSYSNGVVISMDLKPVGSINYTVYVGRYVINVDNIKKIVFIPTENGVKLEGNVNISGNDVGKKIKIVYGDKGEYVVRDININIE